MEETESGGSNDSIPTPISNPSSLESVDTSKKRKVMEPRSVAWNHFEKYEGEDGLTRARCKYQCGKTYAAHTMKNGTTNMRNHITTCPNLPRNIEPTQAQLSFQPVSHGSKDGVITNWKFDQTQSRKALAKMIIVDELPFSFVEKEGFRNFMKVSIPQFNVPSRRTLTRDCCELYIEEKKSLKRFFREAHARVCLTTDTWTSLQRINYMCLTAHFIDKDWTLHKKIINFCPISSHKGDEMARTIERCLLDWNLDNVFTITVDNASSNDVTVKELSKRLTQWGTNIMDGQHLHVRCMAHILNLIVQEGLKEIGDSVKRVRQAVRYIRQSPARIRKFKEFCELEVNLSSKRSLCLDVPTRWNSTYMMLDTAQQFEDVFERYVVHDIGLLHYLRTFVCEDGTSAGELTSEDWHNVRTMVKFLETFYLLTLKVSGSLYVTSNVHFVEIAELDIILKEWMVHEDVCLRNMATKMKEKFVKYWGDPQKMNKMIFIACVLDPRNKLDYVPFEIERMFGEEPGKKLIDEMKKYMASLFEHYVKQSSKHVKGDSSPSTSSGMTSDTSNLSGNSSRATLRTKRDFVRHKEVSGILGAKTELDRYLGEELEPERDDFDILVWWKLNEPRIPVLAEMARNVLAIPISSVASECAFSTGGRILDSFRSSLTPKMVQSLVCVQDWLRSEPLHINVEEDLEYLEQLELDMANNGTECSIIDI